MSAFVRCLVVILTCMIPFVAVAQDKDIKICGSQNGVVSAAGDYASSGWVVLVGSYGFSAAALNKANDITKKYANQFNARVCKIPDTISTYSVEIGGSNASSLEQAASLKSKADSANLAADVVIWRPKVAQ
jgi:hypothetical protein